MRYWIVCLLLLLSHESAQAASLNGCDTSWPLGRQVVRVGDEVGRTLRSIARNKHRVQWLRGPSSTQWTLSMPGHNPRTIHIKIKSGRIVELCQYSG